MDTNFQPTISTNTRGHYRQHPIRGKSPDERRQIRQGRSRPLLDDLERWLRTTLDTLSRKSDTAATILYAPNSSRRCCTTVTTVPSRWTTRRRNALCATWPYAIEQGVSDPPDGLFRAPDTQVAGHARVAPGADRVCRVDAAPQAISLRNERGWTLSLPDDVAG